jgi:hypothetical protein
MIDDREGDADAQAGALQLGGGKSAVPAPALEIVPVVGQAVGAWDVTVDVGDIPGVDEGSDVGFVITVIERFGHMRRWVAPDAMAIGQVTVVPGDEILLAQAKVSRDEVIHGGTSCDGCEIRVSAGDFRLTLRAALGVKGLSLDTSGGLHSVREITRRGRASEP